MESIKEEVTDLSRQSEIVQFGQQMDALLQDGDNREKYDRKTSEILGGWKQEYNRLCRI